MAPHSVCRLRNGDEAGRRRIRKFARFPAAGRTRGQAIGSMALTTGSVYKRLGTRDPRSNPSRLPDPGHPLTMRCLSLVRNWFADAVGTVVARMPVFKYLQ